MKVLFVLLTLLGIIAVSTGCVFAQIYFAKKKSKLWGLIPVGGLFLAALIVFIILLACNVGFVKSALWFFLFYVPIIVALVSYVILRRKHLRVIEDMNTRQNMISAARHMEAERHRRLTEQLRHFSCSVSSLSAKEQQ